MCIYIHAHTHIYMQECMYACMHACMYACMHTCMRKYIHAYTRTSTRIHADMHICMHTRSCWDTPITSAHIVLFDVETYHMIYRCVCFAHIFFSIIFYSIQLSEYLCSSRAYTFFVIVSKALPCCLPMFLKEEYVTRSTYTHTHTKHTHETRTLQICPLTGDWKDKLRERYEVSQIETEFGGELDVATRSALPLLRYQPVPYSQMVPHQARGAAVSHSEGVPAKVSSVEHASLHAPDVCGSEARHSQAEQGEETVEAEGVAVAVCRSGYPEEIVDEEDAHRPQLITKDLPRVTRASGCPVEANRGMSIFSSTSNGSFRAESEDEFLTPVTSPGTQHDSPDQWMGEREATWPHAKGAESVGLEAGGGERKDEMFASVRPRAAIVTTGALDDGNDGHGNDGMTKTTSDTDLAAQQHQVLHSAHGGVWDAHSSTERAVLMKAAIHSMTEVGLDEEVAQKVFELDKAAVERVLSAAARGAQNISAETRLDELLAVAHEYGLLLDKSGSNTPLVQAATPTSPIVINCTVPNGKAQAAHECTHETYGLSRPRTPPPTQPSVVATMPSGHADERGALQDGGALQDVMITDDYLREIYRSVGSALGI